MQTTESVLDHTKQRQKLKEIFQKGILSPSKIPCAFGNIKTD